MGRGQEKNRSEVGKILAEIAEKEDAPVKSKRSIASCKHWKHKPAICGVCDELLNPPTIAHAQKHGYSSVQEMADAGQLRIKESLDLGLLRGR